MNAEEMALALNLIRLQEINYALEAFRYKITVARDRFMIVTWDEAGDKLKYPKSGIVGHCTIREALRQAIEYIVDQRLNDFHQDDVSERFDG